MKTLDFFINTLEQAGYRITRQRRAVCDYLSTTVAHPTPYQVFDELAQRHPDISRATVYNTLNLLQELGAIVEISFGDEHTHYETDVTPHINLVCLRCHSIQDIHHSLSMEEIREQMQSADFQPVVSKTEIYGFCRDCRTQRQDEIRTQWRAQQDASSRIEKDTERP